MQVNSWEKNFSSLINLFPYSFATGSTTHNSKLALQGPQIQLVSQGIRKALWCFGRNTTSDGTVTEGQEKGSHGPRGLPVALFTAKMAEQNGVPGIYWTQS